MNRCSKSLVIRKLKFKIEISLYAHKLAKITNLYNTKFWQEFWEIESFKAVAFI